MAAIECNPESVELTYGLESVIMFTQSKKNVFDLDWNKEGIFRIGRIFMYRDEKAFIECQKIFREFENENSDIQRKISSSRGVVLDEHILE